MTFLGTHYLSRIICFSGKHFSSQRRDSRKLELPFLQTFLFTRVVVLLIGAAIPLPALAHAQAQTGIQPLGRQQMLVADSASTEDQWFTIDNPRNQTIPVSEAKTIYLSACRVVEQEFSRTDRLRPRLKLLLGSGNDRVYYPKREIQLTKWDKYKFAQGVVILAADSLLPEDKKHSLTNLAVSEAEAVVDVRELKNLNPDAHSRPRN